MKLLALDTSQIQAVAALIEIDATSARVIASEEGSTSVAASEAALPLIDTVLSRASLKLGDLDGFAVGVGPGSFTGLRIGCATIKALAQVTGKGVIPLSSLFTLASSVEPKAPESVVVFVNAYQGMVFVGFSAAGQWSEGAAIVSDWMRHHLKREASETQQPLMNRVFCGSGARIYTKDITDAFHHTKWRMSPMEHISPEGLAQVALIKTLELGEKAFVSYREVQAHYIRPSQAELKWEATITSQSSCRK